MKINRYIALGLVFFILNSCEKEIEYKGEGKAPVLVLDAIMENHKTPVFYLSRSVFFLSNNTNSSDAAISDAQITFTNVTDNKTEIIQQGLDGYYYSGYTIEPNKTYRIEVSHPKYPDLKSEITTVTDVPLLAIDSNSTEGIFGRIHYVNSQFSDPVGEQFYAFQYRARVEHTYYDFDSSVLFVDTIIQRVFMESEDPSFDFHQSDHLWLKDDIFNGQKKVFQSKSQDYFYFGFGSDSEERLVGWNVGMTVYSEGVFRYYKTLGSNQENGPFNDPSNVYTNIEGGLGIFGSFSRTFLEL